MKTKIVTILILIAACYFNVYAQDRDLGLGCGLCATNVSTGVTNCCGADVFCSTCTLATACRGQEISLTHVAWNLIGYPYDPMNCNPTYWSIYVSCSGSTPGPLYQPVFITAGSTYTMNTTSMPPGVYWISAACCPPPSGGCCATAAYQIVIED